MSSEKKNGKSSLPSEYEPVDSSRRNLLKGASMVGVAALGSSAEYHSPGRWCLKSAGRCSTRGFRSAHFWGGRNLGCYMQLPHTE